MKPHSSPPPRLLITAFALLGLASCVAPGNHSNGGFGSGGAYSRGIGVYSSLPPGYTGDAYHHGNRYYSGGRYETGSFNYQGRRYDNRYQQGNGSYLYGGEHQHYPGQSSSHDRGSHASLSPVRGPGAGFLPGFPPFRRP
jgi:hypothetical protein